MTEAKQAQQGSILVRWAAVEAVSRLSIRHRLGQIREQSRWGQLWGRDIGVVAVGRELLILVFSGLRDGHARCLDGSAHDLLITVGRARAVTVMTPRWQGRPV
jgi:hypothetical protein